MRFSVSGDRVKVTSGLREYIERRLYFTLGRFGTEIDHVSVRVGDESSPCGGVGKYCLIVVKLRNSGSTSLTIDDHDQNMRTAVARASNHAGRTVERAVERKPRKRAYRRRPMIAGDASHTIRLDDQGDLG